MEEGGQKSVQELHAPSSICFGCGPSNKDGLRIRSFRGENGLEMEFEPTEEHQAFPGMINGGIIGTLLDCHGNWTAAIALMDQAGASEPPCTVTASYSIKLRRPTPFGFTLSVSSEVVEIGEDRARVMMSLSAGGKLCATGEGLFVSVKEGHPAFHRWN
ncbi:MAG: PaaI family thioesterase [Candidatus Thermoplasmatota archaeon]|jgi:acyl-coenzyme A thioesterase PaaI-like protein|nr:PaaI family thioesterase [Candidatus Thermoplasmatota archaeon]